MGGRTLSRRKESQDLACKQKELASRRLLGLLLGEHLLVELQLLALEDVTVAAARLTGKNEQKDKTSQKKGIQMREHQKFLATLAEKKSI